MCEFCKMTFRNEDNSEATPKRIYMGESGIYPDEYSLRIYQMFENGKVVDVALIADCHNVMLFDMSANFCPVCGRFLRGDTE